MGYNTNLLKAKSVKNDEFYTCYDEVEKEVAFYTDHFKNKVVYCNCDDPMHSQIFKFFCDKFDKLELKEVIATGYRINGGQAIFARYLGGSNFESKPLFGDGDFRSTEAKNLLKQADIVVTNPPFSLFREFVSLLMEYKKEFLIIGTKNAVTYKEIFPLLKEGKIWLGCVPTVKQFMIPEGLDRKNTFTKDGKLYAEFGNIGWYTNLTHKKRNEELILFRKYNPKDYPKYDNYDAIEVSKVVDIPCDYAGVMGVPITFLDKYNPSQFEILGNSRYHDGQDFPDDISFINGKELYSRILIRNKNPKPPEE